MTEAQDKLHMRAEPKRRIVRFKKGVVIGGAAVASAGLLGVTMLALQTPNLRNG
jgi:type IV secretion system protein TrbI